MLLDNWLAQRAETCPDRLAVVTDAGSIDYAGLEAEASAMARRLAAKGYPSFVTTVTTPGASAPTGFRIRIGKYDDRREAETVSRRLQKEEQFKPWITQ